MMPNWSFGIREDDVQANVEKARKDGAALVVLLSHNGFDVDRKLAARVNGIDVILTAHTHDALPDVVKVGKTCWSPPAATASSCRGSISTCATARSRTIASSSSRCSPTRSRPTPRWRRRSAASARRTRRCCGEVVGRTETLLYRRGNFNGTLDDLICDALLAERDAEIALSPGFRWGASLLPGHDITREDIYNATAITYPAAYRMTMTGARLKEVLEDVADNLFNPDPYYQQGGDMVRVGGIAYTIDIDKPIGSRISDLTLLRTDQPLEAGKDYVVAGWASVNEGTEGPPIWDVVGNYIRKKRVVAPKETGHVRVAGRLAAGTERCCQPAAEKTMANDDRRRKTPTSRRGFLRTALAAGGATALAGPARGCRRRQSGKPAAERSGLDRARSATASPCANTASRRSTKPTSSAATWSG